LRERIGIHGGVLEIGLRIALLGVDEDGEFGRVTEEKDRRVVEHPIPIAFLCVELHTEASGISGRVCRALLPTNSTEACHAFGLLSDIVEHVQ